MGNGHIARAINYNIDFLYGDVNYDNLINVNDIVILIKITLMNLSCPLH